MIINALGRTIAYSFEAIGIIETALNEIEVEVLKNDAIKGNSAKIFVGELNCIRDTLHLKRGIQRHDKFANDE